MPWVVVPFPYLEHNGIRIYFTWAEQGGVCHRYRFSTSTDIENERYHFDVRALPLAGVERLERCENEVDEAIAIADLLCEAIDRGLLREGAVPLSGLPH